jgi:hypothetical protein
MPTTVITSDRSRHQAAEALNRDALRLMSLLPAFRSDADRAKNEPLGPHNTSGDELPPNEQE